MYRKRKDQGQTIARQRVARLMREAGLNAGHLPSAGSDYQTPPTRWLPMSFIGRAWQQ